MFCSFILTTLYLLSGVLQGTVYECGVGGKSDPLFPILNFEKAMLF